MPPSCKLVEACPWPDQSANPPGVISRLKKGEQDKPVYEAWNIRSCPGKRQTVEGYKMLGLKLEAYDEFSGRAFVTPQPSAQSELADMHLRAIDDFGSKHKRSWAARAFCGKGTTYEQDLDERCRGLPAVVRTAVTKLLFDRGKATSTQQRTRTWTVVVMRQQLHHRFAQAEFAEVKRHKVRFWKNPKPEEAMQYTVLIRGAETKAFAGENALTTFEPSYNPWVKADNAERQARAREERLRRETRRSKRRGFSPPRSRPQSYFSRTPSHRVQTRSVSPPSYQSPRTRFSAPPLRSPRYESPPPYRRTTRSSSPVRSRSPSVRVRVVPRYNPRPFEGVPTPPATYTPPPCVSAYQPPNTTNTASTFQPRPPFPTYPTLNPISPPPHLATPIQANCPSCRSTRTCSHYSPLLPCRRLIRFHAGVPYHPPCLLCAHHGPPPGSHLHHYQPDFAYPAQPPPPSNWHHPITMPPILPADHFTEVPHYPMFHVHPGGGGGISRRSSLASSVAASSVSWHPSRQPPPAPNPFSPLSTPSLTSAGGGSSLNGEEERVATPEVPRGVVGGEREVDVEVRRGSVVEMATVEDE